MKIKTYTQSQYNKSHTRGLYFGIKVTIKDFLTVLENILIDKHGWTEDEISKLSKEIDYTSDSILKNYITFEDLEELRKEEK